MAQLFLQIFIDVGWEGGSVGLRVGVVARGGWWGHGDREAVGMGMPGESGPERGLAWEVFVCRGARVFSIYLVCYSICSFLPGEAMEKKMSSKSVVAKSHPKFGRLLFDQTFSSGPGVAGIAFGVIMLLLGAYCYSRRDEYTKMLIAGVCGFGAGALLLVTGIHFLLFKTGRMYAFYEGGLVHRHRSSVVEVAYTEVADFSVKKTESGGKMPGTYFNMKFRTRDGNHIHYQLGVDKGDVDRMVRAKSLIKHIQASIPGTVVGKE